MGTAGTVRTLLLHRKELLRQREAAVAAAAAPIDQQLEAIEKQLQIVEDGGEGTIQAVQEDAGLLDVTMTPAPVEHAPAGRIGDELLSWIAQKGPLDFGAIAKDIYGEDSKPNRQKIHSALHHLKKKGTIADADDGGYTICPPRKKRGRKPKPKATTSDEPEE